ncbi:uncharacterized protein Z518_03339 [Rhinocladiella mackenziei CBS 650.93]|uniref:Uncharacterized protein n=1 Tax=Rhinocladiella mackenziei CBS 650.93 TaxID=1442369 RepID=A0A0D2G2C5_9EURO|nr:uncharacterized protein Z518_03339 [Rhinocladiella mackenziei CBS 650.93]KIX08682.1 hypothetical protein Z518_03339 [Rhinocladiella mackenziei CBS 650.93]
MPHDDYDRKLREREYHASQKTATKFVRTEIGKALEDSTTGKLYQELLSLRRQGTSFCDIGGPRLKLRAYQVLVNTRSKARWKELWLNDRYNRILQTRERISNNKTTAAHDTKALFRGRARASTLARSVESSAPQTREHMLPDVADLLTLPEEL